MGLFTHRKGDHQWCFLEISCHLTQKCPKMDFLKTSSVICLGVLAHEQAANKLQRCKALACAAKVEGIFREIPNDEKKSLRNETLGCVQSFPAYRGSTPLLPRCDLWCMGSGECEWKQSDKDCDRFDRLDFVMPRMRHETWSEIWWPVGQIM